ncbi:unnamed protein product [Closterium sp. NIES-54]
MVSGSGVVKQTIVVDARHHMLGRLASIVAKELLNGQHVVVVRCEDICLSGGLVRQKMKYLRFLRKRMNTKPSKGPFHFRAPSKIFWRTLRGMIPHKIPRGAAALDRLKAFEGIPAPYDKMKRVVIPDALKVLRLKPGHKFCLLGHLSHEVGWHYWDVVKELEAKRKADAVEYYKEKKATIKTRADAVKGVLAADADLSATTLTTVANSTTSSFTNLCRISRVIMLTVASFVTSLMTSALLFLLLLSLFAILIRRPANFPIYFPKCILRGHGPPPLVEISALEWLRRVLRCTEQDVVNSAGLDAAVYLRIQHMCLLIVLWHAAYCLPVLIPLCATGGYYSSFNAGRPPAEQIQYSALDAIAMGNVPPNDSRLWAFFVGAYWSTLGTLLILHRTYRHVSRLRAKQREEDPEVQVEEFAVLLRNIPPHRSAPKNTAAAAAASAPVPGTAGSAGGAGGTGVGAAAANNSNSSGSSSRPAVSAPLLPPLGGAELGARGAGAPAGSDNDDEDGGGGDDVWRNEAEDGNRVQQQKTVEAGKDGRDEELGLGGGTGGGREGRGRGAGGGGRGSGDDGGMSHSLASLPTLPPTPPSSPNPTLYQPRTALQQLTAARRQLLRAKATWVQAQRDAGRAEEPAAGGVMITHGGGIADRRRAARGGSMGGGGAEGGAEEEEWEAGESRVGELRVGESRVGESRVGVLGGAEPEVLVGTSGAVGRAERLGWWPKGWVRRRGSGGDGDGDGEGREGHAVMGGRGRMGSGGADIPSHPIPSHPIPSHPIPLHPTTSTGPGAQRCVVGQHQHLASVMRHQDRCRLRPRLPHHLLLHGPAPPALEGSRFFSEAPKKRHPRPRRPCLPRLPRLPRLPHHLLLAFYMVLLLLLLEALNKLSQTTALAQHGSSHSPSDPHRLRIEPHNVAEPREVSAVPQAHRGTVRASAAAAAAAAAATAAAAAALHTHKLTNSHSHSLSPVLRTFIEAFLPQLALILFLALLPRLLLLLSLFEGLPSRSHAIRAASGKYFYFTVLNVFIGTALTSGVFQAIKQILDHPTAVVDLLGSSLPQAATFFISYISLRFLVGAGLELTRLVPLVLFHARRRLLCCTQPDLRDAWKPGEPDYVSLLPGDLLVATLALCYAVISPLILPFAAAYFLTQWLVMKNQLVQVYDNEFESRGRIFPHALARVLAALVLSQLTLIGYFGVKQFPATPALIPLLFISVIHGVYMHRRFHASFARPSLQQASRAGAPPVPPPPEEDKIREAYLPEEMRRVQKQREWEEEMCRVLPGEPVMERGRLPRGKEGFGKEDQDNC